MSRTTEPDPIFYATCPDGKNHSNLVQQRDFRNSKTRLGWDSENIRIVEVARLAEQSGAAGLTIHCRTRAQAHKGDPIIAGLPRLKKR